MIRDRLAPVVVVLHELIPGQEDGDRVHVVWVILGNRIYKASVHSVRPMSDRERLVFEAKGDDSHTWQQLSDMIPKREFVDMTGEEPGEDETEEGGWSVLQMSPARHICCAGT